MSRSTSYHVPRTSRIESIQEVLRWLRLGRDRMAVFRSCLDDGPTFERLCAENRLDAHAARVAVEIITNRALVDIDPFDERPWAEIHAERQRQRQEEGLP